MCLSGSTLDASADGPRFESRCPTGGVAASRRAGAVVGRTAAGGWAHFLFMSYVAVGPSSVVARQGYTVVWLKEAKAGGAPVPGRARLVGGSTATGRVRTGDLCDDSQQWLPLCHTASLTTLSSTKTQLQVSSLALYLLRSGPPPTASLSLSRPLSRIKGRSGRSVCLYPPRGSNPPPQDRRGAAYPLCYDELLPALWSTHSVHQRCIASRVALALLGTQHQEPGQERLIFVYRGLVP